MKNFDFTLELSDGTRVKVGSMANSRHPDIKASFLPAGILQPFTNQNLPPARSSRESKEMSLGSAR